MGFKKRADPPDRGSAIRTLSRAVSGHVCSSALQVRAVKPARALILGLLSAAVAAAAFAFGLSTPPASARLPEKAPLAATTPP